MTENQDGKTAKEVVEEILEENPDARESDTQLIIKFFEKKTGMVFPIDDEDVPSVRTITRHRQTIQNEEGRFLPEEDD